MKSPTAKTAVAENQPAAGSRSKARATWVFIRSSLVAYLLIVLLMLLLETWLVYPIPPANAGDWQPEGLHFEDVWFTSADGTKLHGWFVPHPAPKRAIVYCHGNGEHVAFNADLAAHLRDSLQASVLLFDYRGYGRSEGRPDEAGCIADGVAAQRWLAERIGAKPQDIVIIGRSLGAAVGVAMAAQQGARALVLENGFSRMSDVAAYHYPWLPVQLVMRNRYDCLDRIRNYHGPLFQCHGSIDDIVPFRLGRELFDAAPSKRKRFLELTGLGHNDPLPGTYYRELAEFLDAEAPKDSRYPSG